MSAINKHKVFYIFLVFILSYWSIKPLLTSGFFPMHDDTQPARIQQMSKALLAGQFPVRWVPDLGYGYGYPIFNFYAPLPYYIGAFFNLSGIEVITATKLMFFVGVLLSGISMFFLAREIAGGWGGLVSAMLYVYAPYHAVNIYVRGAVGEYYAYAFLPLLILGIYKKYFPLISVSLALILISHNILGMITLYFLLVFLVAYLAYLLIKKRSLFVLWSLFFGLCLGLGLSAFFTLPAIVEKKFTKVEELTGGGSDFRQHFVYPEQLWQSEWGYAGSALGKEDGMSFKIGKLHLIIGIFSFFVYVFLFIDRKIKREKLFFYGLVFIGLVLSVFLTFESSRFLWEILPSFSYIQYPWRFLNFIILFLSLVSSLIFFLIPKKLSLFMCLILSSAVLLINAKYFQPKLYLPKEEDKYISQESLRYSISKMSDEYLPRDFKIPMDKSEIAYIVKIYEDKPTEKIYMLDMPYPDKLIFNIANFPGWEVFIDGKAAEITSQEGKVTVDMQGGLHIVSLIFKNTGIRRLANTISFFSLILLVYVSLFFRRRTLWQVKNKV